MTNYSTFPADHQNRDLIRTYHDLEATQAHNPDGPPVTTHRSRISMMLHRWSTRGY